MATNRLESIKDPDNEYVFALRGMSYVNGLVPAMALKADDENVVHLNGAETITGHKTFSNGLTAAGTTTVNAFEVSGNQHNDGTLSVDSTITGNTNIISKGSVQSRRTSYPLVGAMRVDSNGDQLGYAKLEVDNANKLMLVCAAESGSSDTKVIRYANGAYHFYGTADTSNATYASYAIHPTTSAIDNRMLYYSVPRIRNLGASQSISLASAGNKTLFGEQSSKTTIYGNQVGLFFIQLQFATTAVPSTNTVNIRLYDTHGSDYVTTIPVTVPVGNSTATVPIMAANTTESDWLIRTVVQVEYTGFTGSVAAFGNVIIGMA